MQLIEVIDTATANNFLKINVLINQSNECYVRPLDSEISNIFNPAANKNFKHGQAKRWILCDNDTLVGRIAAFTNEHYINKDTHFKTGCIGFFDCINEQAAATMLFDAAKQWLQLKGMEAMDGPINFGNRDKWWGLLVDGFDYEPLYGMPFNRPYYKVLFETYGFKNYYDQYYYKMHTDDALPERFAERYDKFKSKPGYTAKHISKKNLEQHAEDFTTVYNAAWAQHEESKQITKEEVLKLFNVMKIVMDERLIWFAYYKDEPIAMWVNIPDLNQYFKHFNGKFGLLQKLQLLWMKNTGACKRFTGIAFGVVPKYQALGIDSFLIYEGASFIQSKRLYKDYEMGWAANWNPKMLNIYKSLGARQSRHLITYRHIFDESKHSFERHPVMEYHV